MAGHLEYSHRTRKKFPRVATCSTRNFNFDFQLRRTCPCKLSVRHGEKQVHDRLKSPGNRLRLVSREPMKLLVRSSFVGSRYQPLAPDCGSISRLVVHDLKQQECVYSIRGGFTTLSNPQPSPPCSLITVRASSSSRIPANLEWRRWSTYASYCTPSWREPPNRGRKDSSVSTRRNDGTAFKRCMQIPPKRKAQLGWLSHRQVL